MATLIEDAMWTITEEVGDHMVETGLLFKCENAHCNILEVDKPIYHISHNAPTWFGFASIPQAIKSAEEAVESNKKEK